MILTVFTLRNMSNVILKKLVDKAIVFDYHNEFSSVAFIILFIVLYRCFDPCGRSMG